MDKDHINESYDNFLEHEFNNVSRPIFRDIEERENVMKVWDNSEVVILK